MKSTNRSRAHRVALPARTAAETVTDLAHIYRESPGPVRIQHQMLSPDVSGDGLVDASPSTYHPVSSDWLRGSRPCVLLRGRVSVRHSRPWLTVHPGSCRDRTDMRRSAGRYRRGLDCLRRTDDGRSESRFVPLAPSKRQLLKRDRFASPIAIATSVIRTLAVLV